jgi:cytochrome c oxidase subunit 2
LTLAASGPPQLVARPLWRLLDLARRIGVLLVVFLAVACAQAANPSQAPTRLDADQPVRNPPGFFPPTPTSEQGHDISALYSLNFWIATAIFLLVEGIIVWCVLRYRRRSDRMPPQTHGNTIAEIAWTVVPAILVMIVFVASTFTLYRVEAKSASPDVTVDAYAFQWQWAFGYDCPASWDQAQNFTKIDDCGTPLPAGTGDKGPEMVLPVGETVHIRLHSTDVNHAFYVAQFLYKKDVIPGQVNNFDVKVAEPGTFTGQCAEFCGLAHASMTFTVRAVPPTEFATWKQQAKAAAEERKRATPAPEASPPAGSATLSVSASTPAAFDQKTLEAPANTPFTIQFQNKDPAVQHNVAIKNATPQGDFIPPLAGPGQSANYSVPALQAGQYTYYCSVHPNMTGTLTVK